MNVRRTIITAAAVLGVATASAPAASAETAAPAGPHVTGTAHGQDVYGWNAVGGASWYSIRLDGHQVRKDLKRTLQVQVYDLYLYCHALRGHSYTLSIVAVDGAGHQSAPSAGVLVTVK